MGMHTIQLIQHHQRPVAVVVRGRAIVSDRVGPDDLPTVHAMCRYALEVDAGERSGPYADADAEAYARALPASEQAAAARAIRHRRPIRGARRRR